MPDSSTTSHVHITVTDAQVFPPRGHGHVRRGDVTYYYWYRARINEWYMGAHTTKPVHNHLHHTDEYDGPQVFHHHVTKDTHITAAQASELLMCGLHLMVEQLWNTTI